MFDTAAHAKKLYCLDQYITSSGARIIGIDEGCMALDRTVLYPESGGQKSDTGLLETPFGTLRIMAAKLLHGMAVTVHLNAERRQKLTLSHSASHFLYAAAVALRPELKENTITIEVHPKNADARMWVYEDIRMPCAGAHLNSPQNIRCIRVTRKTRQH